MKRTLSITLASLLIVICLALTANAQGKLTAGVAKSDITPPVGTPLAGSRASDRRGLPTALSILKSL